jgi:hypothetical protein
MNNHHLQILDLSYNTFGSSGGIIDVEECAIGFRDMFFENKTLLHIDLSHNAFNQSEVEMISN